MSDRYILDSHGEPIPCEDLIEWGKWMGVMDRHVALTKVYGVRISTVFLGLDHNFYGGEPILFETMVFGGKHDQYQDRYYHRFEAVSGHNTTVAMVKSQWLISLLIQGLWIKLVEAKESILNYGRKKGLIAPKYQKMLKELSKWRSENGQINTKAEKKSLTENGRDSN